jgi:hypothetical protein
LSIDLFSIVELCVSVESRLKIGVRPPDFLFSTSAAFCERTLDENS